MSDDLEVRARSMLAAHAHVGREFWPPGYALIADLLADRERLAGALRPFADFAAWVEALAENGDLGPLEDHQAVCQLSGGGGSMALTVGELRAARDALRGAEGGR